MPICFRIDDRYQCGTLALERYSGPAIRALLVRAAGSHGRGARKLGSVPTSRLPERRLNVRFMSE
jgi:hypothetical protein